jgi:NADP-dependent 3-hydroxy acid dehydrogenase YdfG
LKGSVAAVTGASGDIGRAISHDLIRADARVLLVGRNRERLTDVAVRSASPENAEVVAADLTCKDGVDHVFATVERARRLDLLVLGSGIYERSHTPDSLARQFAANVHGPYSLLRRVLPRLVDARGQIIFINSTQGLAAGRDVDQFAATQHAMKAIADSLRDEVNPLGVRVASLFLGRTATERQKRIFAGENRAYAPEKLIQPQDVSYLVMCMLKLPRTAEITNVTLRPMQKT